MLIAIIIAVVLASVVSTCLVLRSKKRRMEYLQTSIRSLAGIQFELFGRIQTMLGRHRDDVVPPNVAIERRSREISEQGRELITHAETRLGLTDNSMFLSLKENWIDIEENLSTAFRNYKQQVADYNSTLDIIPANLLAKLLRYQKQPQYN